MAKKRVLSNARSGKDWDDVLAGFEHELYRTGKAERTVATYSSAINVFGRFYRDELGKPGPYVSRLQETDLRAFMDHLRQDRSLSAVSANRFVAALRSFSRFVFGKRWHRRDLARDLRTYRVSQPGRPTRLSKKEVRRLVTSIDLNGRNGIRDLAIVQLFLQCGLRVSELVRLSIDDVTLHKTTGRLRVRAEKGRQERVIPLNASVRNALHDYLETRGPVAGSEPLFLSERRQRISLNSVQHLVKKYLSFAGREDLSTHDLRHHFAIEFYERSGKLTATQQVLGHRDINTTARYARATEQEIEEAIEHLDE
ncbi:MAG: tyrosine-type recombinase/integrase [bacterium]